MTEMPRLLSFIRDGRPGYGLAKAGGVVDLSARLGDRWPGIRNVLEDGALRELFHDGRLAFAIGFVGLAACLFLSWLLTKAYEGPFARLFQESLIIIGWVVIWRPAEMFLYDWVPILRRRKLYRRLATATVEIRRSAPV